MPQPGVSAIDKSGIDLLLLPRHYGCVVVVGGAGVLVNLGLAARVVAHRRSCRVKFPRVHAPDKPEFNLALQHHLDFALGEMTFFYFALLTGGLRAPRLAAASGLVFLLSRNLDRCYGNAAQGQSWSLVSWAAFATLLATSAGFGVSLLRG